MKSERDESGAQAESPAAEPRGEELLDILLDDMENAAPAPLPARIEGVVVGWLGPVNTASGAQVMVARGAEPIAARALVAVAAADEGREVALLFEAGDPTKPMIMGFIQRLAPVATAPLVDTVTSADEGERDEGPMQAMDVQADGERVVLSGKKEIVLQCGKASITLTRAGKILIRGAYVLTRSSGVNRILGGTVEIN